MQLDNEVLGRALVEKGLLKEKNLRMMLGLAKMKGGSLEDMLFEKGILKDAELGQTIADLYKVPFINVGNIKIAEEVLKIVPQKLAASQYVIPFGIKEGKISMAMNNPRNFDLINFVEKKSGYTVEPFYSTKKDIRLALKSYSKDVNVRFKKLLKGALEDPSKIESLQDAAKILDTIILFAFQSNASDIHIEPHKESIVVRYRIDGILQTIAEFPTRILTLLTTRVKVLANLRTDEHRAAQDGRFKIELEGNEIILRVSILPTYEGEKTVLRILSSVAQELNLEALGYSKNNLGVIKKNIKKTHGIILVTGPSGSGKTTSMYSVLKLLNSPEINISTIEDPIEYQLEGVNQIQVNPKTNLTFAAGLKSLLRQDPDILMVGEIRDGETASIAINSALTGHLVIATLHTNDVATTLPRLVDMKIEPFLVSATVQMVIAQRLVRTICEKCKEEYQLTMEQVTALGKNFDLNIDLKELMEQSEKDGKITLYKGKGCAECTDTGFKGRSAIAEVMQVTQSIRKLILENGSPNEIEEKAKEEGMIPIFVDGVNKALKGETTIEEILRVMRS